MSFSRRSSKWANAALVVTVSTKDFDSMNSHGPLAGVEFQVSMFLYFCCFPVYVIDLTKLLSIIYSSLEISDQALVTFCLHCVTL